MATLENIHAFCKTDDAAALAALPALQGSEKQIAWASSIRKDWLEQTSRNLSPKLDATPNPTAHPMWAIISGVYDKVMGETSAAWWIDNRVVTFAELAKKLK